MKSEIYSRNSELELDLARNLASAAVWSANVKEASATKNSKWAKTLAFGTSSRPDLCLSRVRFASAVIEKAKSGAIDGLSELVIPAKPEVKKTVTFEAGKRKTSFNCSVDEDSQDEFCVTAYEFYYASILAYSLYLGTAYLRMAEEMPVEFEHGWEEKKAEALDGIRKAYLPLVEQGMSLLRSVSDRNPSPSSVVIPSPSRFDSGAMGLLGVIRECCGKLVKS